MPEGRQRLPYVPLGENGVRAIGFVCAGFFIVSCADAAVKYALPEVGIAAAMIWRGVFGALAVAIIAGFRDLRPHNTRLIVARSGLHTLVSVAYYGAWVLGMPLAESYAVSSAAPLMMTLLAVPLLGESFGWRRTISTTVGFLGVLIMLRPGGDLWRPETVMLLFGVAALALTRIWTRLLARTDRPETIAFWLLLAHIPAGILLLPIFPGPVIIPAWPVVAALVFLGLANGIAHALFARGFAMAPIYSLAPYEYTPLIWGGGLGYLIWGNVPGWGTIAGAGVVISAGLYNLHREQVRAREGRREARTVPAL